MHDPGVSYESNILLRVRLTNFRIYFLFQVNYSFHRGVRLIILVDIREYLIQFLPNVLYFQNSITSCQRICLKL